MKALDAPEVKPLRPIIEWDHGGRAEFLGRWQVVMEVIKVDDKEAVCYYVDQMPDWARRIVNRMHRIDAVRWGVHGARDIRRDIEDICDRAVETETIAYTEDGWVHY